MFWQFFVEKMKCQDIVDAHLCIFEIKLHYRENMFSNDCLGRYSEAIQRIEEIN
jgi:hypothetical protein